MQSFLNNLWGSLMSSETIVAQGSFTSENVDKDRRRLLIGGTSVVGAVGTAALAIPFISSMSPSERAKAAGAPVEVDISKLTQGQMVTVEWRGKPVWIVYRSKETLKALEGRVDHLRDPDSDVEQQPDYAKNTARSIKSQYLVMIGICTHLGCSPTYRPDLAAPDLGSDWDGGFFCPCHGSKFDFSGRVYSGVPAPTNLIVPPHSYLSDTRIIIGEDGGVA